MIKSRVLFLCSGNSCRTQMAEAFLRHLAGDHFDVISAGADPTPLDPEPVDAMGELGIDIFGQTTKDVSRFPGQRFTYVVSLCDREQERISHPINARPCAASAISFANALSNL